MKYDTRRRRSVQLTAAGAGKETPVSDANLGDRPSKRPGKNAGVTVSHEATAHGKRAKKRPNNRSRKRLGELKDGIQADTIDKSSSANGDTGRYKQNPDGNPADNDDVSRSSKGRRRRWKKKRKNQASFNDNQIASDTRSTVSVEERVEEDASTKPRKTKRKNRRPRAKDHRGSGHPVADEQALKFGKTRDVKPAPNAGDRHSGKSHGKRKTEAYAALDLGTNNCRLLVAVPQQPGRFRVVDAFSRIVRLGEGLAASGRLSDEAMDRAVEALKSCADKLDGRSVKGVRLIATEACRRAVNGTEFLNRVEEEAGLKLEIVDRETEARLAVAGCASLVDRKAKGVVLFDIGGGSSELALLDLRKRKKHDLGPAMVSWTSLPHGVVTLSEKHGGGKLVTRTVFEDMVADVAELLEAYEGRDALEAAGRDGEVHLLGTSGTVTTLAGIHLKLPRYDRRRVDGTWMASKDVDAMIDALVDMSFEERVANPCIGRDRADLVLAGCAILVAIQRLWPCPRLRVADRGLREGLLTEMMNADNAWQRRPRYFNNRSGAQKPKRERSGSKSHG